jgi:Short C-terminal domain
MKIAGWTLSGLSICAALLGCATQSAVVSLGDGTYSVTRKAETAFNRNTDEMTTLAKEDAAHFCAQQGKELKVLDVVVDKPYYATGYVSAKVVFKAINPGEANQVSAPAQGTASRNPPPVELSQKEATDDLYAQLVKLDELRKKGILTDDEFQAEKKKILSHFN